MFVCFEKILLHKILFVILTGTSVALNVSMIELILKIGQIRPQDCYIYLMKNYFIPS